MIPTRPPDRLWPSAHEPSTLPLGAPSGPLRRFRRPSHDQAQSQAHQDQGPKPTAASAEPRPAKRPPPRLLPRRRTTSACSCSALTSSKSRAAPGLSAPSPTSLPRPLSSWASRSTRRPRLMSLKWPRSCRSASSTPPAARSCRTCGKASTATSLSRWALSRSRPRSARTTTRPAPRSPAACPATGTRSRLATSSSPKRASTTAGARRSCSTAKTTCSRCGTATTRGSPSSFGIAPRSR